MFQIMMMLMVLLNNFIPSEIADHDCNRSIKKRYGTILEGIIFAKLL